MVSQAIHLFQKRTLETKKNAMQVLVLLPTVTFKHETIPKTTNLKLVKFDDVTKIF